MRALKIGREYFHDVKSTGKPHMTIVDQKSMNSTSMNNLVLFFLEATVT